MTDTVDTMAETTLPLELIRTDGGTQPRAGLIEEEVEEYTFHLRNGADFPPIDVMYDGQHHYVYDGFHRLEAHKRAQKTAIAVRIQQGTREDAVWLSYRANITNGIRRNPHDRQRAIVGALQHPHSVELTDKAVAAHCGVDPSTISKWRKKLMDEGTLPAPEHDEPAPDSNGAAPTAVPAADVDDDAAALADAAEPVAVDDSRPADAPADAAAGPAPPPEPEEPPAVPDDLADQGWVFTQDADGQWQGQHPDLGVQTEPHADPATAIGQMRDLAQALGVAPDVESVVEPPPDASEAAASPDRVRVALTVNLLGVMYQAADERWQQLAPDEDAWTAVSFDYETLLVAAHQLLDGPGVQEVVTRLPA